MVCNIGSIIVLRVQCITVNRPPVQAFFRFLKIRPARARFCQYYKTIKHTQSIFAPARNLRYYRRTMINRIFQIRGKRINYKLENFSDLSEQKAIDAALGCAFNMAQLILHNLKTADAKTAQSMQKIYGESADAQTLSEAFKKIIEHIEHKFFVRREKIFAGETEKKCPRFSQAPTGIRNRL